MNSPNTVRPTRNDPAPHPADPADEEPEFAVEEDIPSDEDRDAGPAEAAR
jgi:hypothetical protein